MREITITQKDAARRLDKFLMSYLNGAAKGTVYKMLRRKTIKLNARRASGSELLAAGDVLNVYVSEQTLGGLMSARPVSQKAGTPDIIYEDEQILAVNKPGGVLSHPQNPFDHDTLIDRVLFYLSQTRAFDMSAESTFTPALCNRLDRNTSGAVLCGKTPAAVRELNRAMAAHEYDGACGAKKQYRAIVSGAVKAPGRLDGFIRKDAGANESAVLPSPAPAAADAGGKARRAVTAYRPIAVSDASHGSCSLLAVEILTGRSHQIRAHLKSIGHPIIGDPKYGDPAANRFFRDKFGVRGQLLHAETLTLKFAAGPLAYLSGRAFTAPPPREFKTIEEYCFKLSDN